MINMDEIMDKQVINFLKWGIENREFSMLKGAIEWIDTFGVDWDYFKKQRL